MRPSLRNVAVLILATPISYVVMNICGRLWGHFFLDGRSFTVYFGVISAFEVINWAFYFICLGVLGGVVCSLLRTFKPYLWSVAFGLGVYLITEVTTTYIVFADGVAEKIYFLAQRALVVSAIVSGCLVGAFLQQRLRALAPNYSLKRTNQSLRD